MPCLRIYYASYGLKKPLSREAEQPTLLGDGHAGQGDGEVAGTGIEVPLRARVQVDLIKKQAIHWPRFETDRMLMAVGAYRPLDDALRIAFAELVAWLHADYAISELDAYELLSKVASIHLAEMVDPNYVVVAGIDRRYLPAEALSAADMQLAVT